MLVKELEFKLKKDGCEIVAVQNGQEAIEKLGSGEFDLVVTGMMIPFKGGLDVIDAVGKRK
jgi:two-component system response regulator VicR